jgi:signal transduction histidine kinase
MLHPISLMNIYRSVEKILLLFLLVFIHYFAVSQNTKTIDSLSRKLKSAESDTDKIKLYLRLGEEYKNALPDTAIRYYDNALAIARQDSCKSYIASAFNEIGKVQYHKGDYDKATEVYLEALKIYEKINDPKGVASCNKDIGDLYYEQNAFEKAKDYFLRSLKIYNSIGDKKDVAACFNNIGMVLEGQADYNKAIINYSSSLEIRKKLGDKLGMSKCYNNLGNAYSWLKNYNKALEYYSKSLKIKEELNDPNGIATVLVNISDMDVLIGKYADAINCSNKSLDIAKSIKSLMLQRDNYENLSDAYNKLHDYESAFKYHVLFKQAYDSIFNKESNDKIADMQVKYETEKKQRDIEKLQNEKESQDLKLKQSRIIITSVAVGGILLLIIALTMLNGYKQRQSKRRILTTVVETEEKERKRFAEDLHDGLGPLLSSVSLYVNELQSEKHGPDKKKEFFKTANDLIDESIKNTRMIANNLMPGVLNDYGLINALETFCGKLKKTGAIEVTVHSELKDKRYNAVVEITLYRVILELINNTLKHAASSSIDIEIHEKEKFINISYSDNGKGFDVEKTMSDPQKGLGLNNIANRIKTIGGKCNFQSALDKGTQVNIEVNYKKFMV